MTPSDDTVEQARELLDEVTRGMVRAVRLGQQMGILGASKAHVQQDRHRAIEMAARGLVAKHDYFTSRGEPFTLAYEIDTLRFALGHS